MADYEAYKIALGYTGDWSIPQHAHIDATEAVATTVEGLGSVYQAKNATLTALSGVTTTVNELIFVTSNGTFNTTTLTTAGRALLDDADAAAQRTTLGLVIGTNVQAADATLTALAGVTTAADTLIYATGVDTFSTTALTTYGRALLDDTSVAAQRTTLGLGTAATYATGTSGSTVPLLSGENTWGSAQVISVTDNTNPALKITQTGTGHCLLIEDSASPDASPMLINSSGFMVLGNTTTSTVGDISPLFQIHSSSANGIVCGRYSADTVGPIIALGKSRTPAGIGHQLVLNNDTLGKLQFAGADGTDLNTVGAEIKAEVDGTPAANVVPSRVVFSTAAPTTGTLTERMRIDSAGRIGIGATPSYAKLEVAGGSTLPSPTTDASGEDTATLLLNNIGGTPANGSFSSGIAFSGINTTRRRAFIGAIQDTADGDQFGLQFFTRVTTTTANNTLNATPALYLKNDNTVITNGVLDISSSTSGQIKFPATQNASADANTLDDYEEGTWTPSITFGGAAVGLTGTFNGTYTKVGRVVSYQGYLALSAKGSSTGEMVITGLPFTATSGNTYHAVSMRVNNMTSGVGDTFLQAYVVISSTTIVPSKMASGGQTQLTDADLTASSIFFISGQFIV